MSDIDNRCIDVISEGPKDLSSAIDELIVARDEIERLKADSDRLNWIARHPDFICEVVTDREHDGRHEVRTDNLTAYGSTFRDAVDEAMSIELRNKDSEGKQTRTRIPEGTQRVRNVVTGKVQILKDSEGE